ncbi:hypothetical protein [Myxococcus sp. RHSTA-1-4]|uniref:hypothetical protein n=1 Tax=Myxococcus sp. RHSTA-1-4 TaxID=2874601 RepID=UPI001CBFEC16|nr:hypothetical protein [Myxococcus sp. RHSTA-1-4]MBZ4419842.1 hypothetical protein [Myxococcus sp. RHSTA-1-4]
MAGRRCRTWLMAVTLGLAGNAMAWGPDSSEECLAGPQVALSSGIGAGLGYIYTDGVSLVTGEPEDLKITDASSVSLPVLLELGYRVSPRLYLGVWGSYEKVFLKTSDKSCPEGFDCSSWQWRFGPEVQYHFSPGAGFDPWVGLGVGLEIARTDLDGELEVPVPGVGTVPAGAEVSLTDRGPTYARLTVGGDARLTRGVFLGPILTVSIGSYTVHTGEQTVTLPGLPAQTGPVPPADDGFHALFTLGVRVAWLPL